MRAVSRGGNGEWGTGKSVTRLPQVGATPPTRAKVDVGRMASTREERRCRGRDPDLRSLEKCFHVGHVARLRERRQRVEEQLAVALAQQPRIAQHQHAAVGLGARSEEPTSDLQSLMRISYAVFCLKKKNKARK